MRTIFFISLIMLPGIAIAQSTDSIRQRADSLLQQYNTRYDSTNKRLNSEIDSVQKNLNAVLNPDFKNLTDKIKPKYNRLDTLKANHELDSAKSRLTYQIDSLKKLNLPTHKITRKLDSLNKLSPSHYLAKADSKVNELESKVNQPISNVENKVNEKLTLMNKEGGSGSNIPGSAKLPGAELKTGVSTDLKLPTTDLKIDNALGKVENPLGKIDNPLKDEMNQVNELKDKVTEVKNLPREEINKVKSLEEVKTAQNKVGEVNALTDKTQAYSEDVKSIANGDISNVKQLPKDMEAQALKLEGVSELQKQSGEFNQYKELVGKGNDPKAIEELAKRQVITYAQDHFAGQQQALTAAMDKMTKLKTKYSSLDSLTNLPRFKPNQMKGKPFIERIVPGITFQVQKSTTVLIDYCPLIGYRITDRLSVGLGWNERIGVTKSWDFTIAERIYGLRSFVEFKITKGLSAKVDVEKMNTLVPTSLVNYADERGRAWIWSAFVGIKKQYKFSKHVKGNFQFLYNLYDDHDSSPYTQRFNVRFGFEFPMKKSKLSADKQSKSNQP